MLTNPPSFSRWRCANCGKWNKGEHCTQCKSDMSFADAYQLENELATPEKAYYSHSVPEIIRVLRSIEALLCKIVK